MSSSSYLVSHADPSDPAGHLVCFHHAGGAARAFSEWPDKWRSSLAIDAVELPGRGKRFGDALPSDLTEEADAIAEELGREWTNDLPVILFGHSLGALLAGATAVTLEERGLALGRVIVSGTRPPHRREPGELHTLSDEQLKAELQEMGGTPPAVFEQPELMELYLPVIRADMKIVETYEPRDRPLETCGITAIAGKDDHRVDRLEPSEWERYTRRDVVVNGFPGDHFYLKTHADRVVRWMENHLISSGVLPG